MSENFHFSGGNRHEELRSALDTKHCAAGVSRNRAANFAFKILNASASHGTSRPRSMVAAFLIKLWLKVTFLWCQLERANQIVKSKTRFLHKPSAKAFGATEPLPASNEELGAWLRYYVDRAGRLTTAYR